MPQHVRWCQHCTLARYNPCSGVCRVPSDEFKENWTGNDELITQLVHASNQVRRLRAQGDTVEIVEWWQRREALLEALSARMSGKQQDARTATAAA